MDAREVSKPIDQAVFRAIRGIEFPWTADTVYMDNAAIGPLPERTRRFLDEFNRRRAAPHLLDPPQLHDSLQEARSVVARLLNAGTDGIGLATNTSFGLNVAAQSLPLEPGDAVLVSEGEFPANVYPWLRLRERGIHVELAPTTAAGWPNEDYLVERLHEPAIRALAISLVQFSNGYRADLARLGRACREAGCFLVVDGIQAIGQVAFDVQETPVDILACGAQKWLLSPWGSGFVYVRRELLEVLAPPVVGWMAFDGTDDTSNLTSYAGELRSDARRFELNTLPFQDLLAMTVSINLLLELGIDNIAQWLREVRQPLIEFANRLGMPIVSPTDPNHETGIMSVVPPSPQETHSRLRAEGVVCSLREGAIRIAPHCYNTPEEMEQVTSILAESG
jgi:selenocysteine lyase/cysteine desulfurase